MQDDRSHAIDELLQASMRGRTSRREILKRAAALGLSAPMFSLMLRSHGVAAQDVAPGSTIVVPQGIRTDLKGQKITAILGEATSPDKPFEQAAVKKFTDATGIAVNVIPGEQDANDRLTKYNQALGSKSSDTDVFMIDVIWPGVVAEHAIDLNEKLKDLAAKHFEAIVKNNTVNNKLVGMPWFTDAGLLYYRTDLLQKYKIANPPATWAELETAAKTIMDGEKGANADFYGFVFQGKAYEGLTCNALEWQVANGGGNVIEPDGTVSINNPQAAAAFDRAKGWVKGIAPESVTTYNEPSSLNDFIAGRAAFMRNWPYAWAASQDPKQSKIAGKVGVQPLPKGDGDKARNADTLGGWQLMVSKYSKSQDAAIEFVKFMCSPEIEKSFAVERSHLPTIASVYDDADVAKASEFIPRLKPVFSGGAVARPSSVSGRLYPRVSSAYWTTVNDILKGNKSGADGVKDLEGKLKQIMADKG